MLCLDVELTELAPDEPPPTTTRLRTRFPHPIPRAPKVPPPPIIRGVSEDVAERLTQPWRQVVSATACRLDPREPFTLNDSPRTPAQLVTVRMLAKVAGGAVKIEWTGASADDPRAVSSRDCEAVAGGRGWTVTCGGTWFE